jgi:hypothetical protein
LNSAGQEKNTNKTVNYGDPRSSFRKGKVDHMRTKTISDYPLLIGELIRRSELRKARRQRWSAIFKGNRPAQKD